MSMAIEAKKRVVARALLGYLSACAKLQQAVAAENDRINARILRCSSKHEAALSTHHAAKDALGNDPEIAKAIAAIKDAERANLGLAPIFSKNVQPIASGQPLTTSKAAG